MNINEVKAELAFLRKEIKRHNKKYYELDEPEISDFEYDNLMNRLKEIEKNFPEFITPTSPTQTVGGSARRTASKFIPHDVQMLSLQDVFSREEVKNFIEDTLKKIPTLNLLSKEICRFLQGKFIMMSKLKFLKGLRKNAKQR